MIHGHHATLRFAGTFGTGASSLVDFDLQLTICRRLLWESSFDVSAVTVIVCKLSSLVSASQTCLQMFHLYVWISVCFGAQELHTGICMSQVTYGVWCPANLSVAACRNSPISALETDMCAHVSWSPMPRSADAFLGTRASSLRLWIERFRGFVGECCGRSSFDVSAVTVIVCKLSSLVSASQTCLQMFHLYVRMSVLGWEARWGRFFSCGVGCGKWFVGNASGTLAQAIWISNFHRSFERIHCLQLFQCQL